jgi:hypothetical protein
MFRSQYELVSFTLEPYQFAKEQGARNTAMVNDLIALNLEDRITDREFMLNFFRAHLNQGTAG